MTSTLTDDTFQSKTRYPDDETRHVVNFAFMLMRDAFPQQFINAFPNPETLDRARSLWRKGLSDIHPQLVKQAAIKAIKESKFLPSLSELRRLASTKSYEEYGMRQPLQAYYEACRATNRTREGVWSHVAVYIAARETGWSFLESEPQTLVFPIFERNYDILYKRLLAGEDLDAEINKGLENHANRDALRCANDLAEKNLRAKMEAQEINPNGGRAEFLRVMADL